VRGGRLTGFGHGLFVLDSCYSAQTAMRLITWRQPTSLTIRFRIIA
jgi:hypothetical protein